MVTIFIFCSFVLLNVFVGTTKGDCPTIISRSQWGARAASPDNLGVNPPKHVIIHHAETPSCTTKTKCTARVKSIQNHHMDTNKWDDIGYNFLVGEDGNVYEGRGWGKHGAHAPAFNSKSIGICVIGNFESKLPNDAALQAVKDLISCGVSKGKITKDYVIAGHRQVRATSCPGDKFYEEIKKWPNWTSQP